MIKFIEWLRDWWDTPSQRVQDKIYNQLQDKAMMSMKPIFEANRHYIASIGVEDFDEYLTTLSEQEKKDYEAEASVIFKNKVFQRELKHLESLQARYVAAECENWERNLVGRGTMNGIGLILDRFETLNARHLENTKPPEGSDPHGLMPGE